MSNSSEIVTRTTKVPILDEGGRIIGLEIGKYRQGETVEVEDNNESLPMACDGGRINEGETRGQYKTRQGDQPGQKSVGVILELVSGSRQLASAPPRQDGIEQRLEENPGKVSRCNPEVGNWSILLVENGNTERLQCLKGVPEGAVEVFERDPAQDSQQRRACDHEDTAKVGEPRVSTIAPRRMGDQRGGNLVQSLYFP
jgi:hypothetical protein